MVDGSGSHPSTSAASASTDQIRTEGRWVIGRGPSSCYVRKVQRIVTFGALLILACDPAPGPDAGPMDGATPRDTAALDTTPFDTTPADTEPPIVPTCLTHDGVDRAIDGTVSVDDPSACHRTYTIVTDAARRDDLPASPRTIAEREGWPTVRTANPTFDALHALALEEVRENSVAAVRDYAFGDGAAIDCGPGGCFETGRLWNYVWTRDIAYATHLGLARIDSQRARNSLEFKLSERRGGGDLQIVQDTGSGGSYPVSSDRVAWALGAEALLDELTGAERDAFVVTAHRALTNTVEHDRRVVFDPRDGLYRGEQSFLDWREQTYPDWTAGDVVHIAMSKALSTNLLHLRALELTARLSEERGMDPSRYRDWADALREAIRARFWIESEGLFSTFITTELDPAPVRRFDLLGSALAIMLDVATEAQARRMLASYPHFDAHTPVAWPHQQLTPIYHNRAMWPFVTAYWLRAAAHARNDASADHSVRSLMHGPLRALTNVENLEVASGETFVDDGSYSGPVINSQRQLWSVAGYLSMVHTTLFGVSVIDGDLDVSPKITATMREELFGGSGRIVLNELPFRGSWVSIVIELPASPAPGWLAIAERRLDGVPVADLGALREGEPHLIEIVMESGSGSTDSIRIVDDADWRDVFGPRTPGLAVSADGGNIALALSLNTEAPADVSWTIYRDGEVIADALAGTSTRLLDPDLDASTARSPCYAAELTFEPSGNHSQHSPPACYWGASLERVQVIDAGAMSHVGGEPSSAHGRFHYEPWGDPGDSLRVESFVATRSGPHLFQVTFGNGAGPIDSGVTCAVKRLVVEEVASGARVAEGALRMPHLGDWARWEDSSFVPAELAAGVEYRITIRGDEDVSNMSAFAHFADYTAGLGGRSGAFNRVNIASLTILAR